MPVSPRCILRYHLSQLQSGHFYHLSCILAHEDLLTLITQWLQVFLVNCSGYQIPSHCSKVSLETVLELVRCSTPLYFCAFFLYVQGLPSIWEKLLLKAADVNGDINFLILPPSFASKLFHSLLSSFNFVMLAVIKHYVFYLNLLVL